MPKLTKRTADSAKARAQDYFIWDDELPGLGLRVYSLRPEPFRAIDDWVRSYRKLWESRLDRFDAALARRRNLRRGEGKK